MSDGNASHGNGKSQPNGNARDAGFREGDGIGKYVVVRHLGSDSLVSRYLVRHTVEETVYVLHLVPKRLSRSKGFKRRFQALLTTLKRLNHPNVVRIAEGSVEQPPYFVVSDFVGAEDSEETCDLGALVGAGGCFDESTIRHVLLQVCAGLEHAHQQGVSHGQLRPDSILLTRRDPSGAQALVRGFVESHIRALSRRKSDSRRPAGGLAEGGAGEASPSQDDVAADVRGLGLLLQAMLTGEADPSEVGSPSDSVRESHPELVRLMERCVSEDRDRIESISEVAAALHGSAASEASPGERFQAEASRRRRRAAARVAAAVALLLPVALAAWYGFAALRGPVSTSVEKPGVRRPSRAYVRREIAKRLASACDALARGDHAMASEEVEHVLALAPGNNLATAIQEKIEDGKGVVATAPLRGKAKQKLHRLPNLNRGQGFGEQVDTVQSLFYAAETFFENKYYDHAREEYREVIARADALLRLDQKRSSVAQARESAYGAREEAIRAGASATSLWYDALQAANVAEHEVPQLPDDYYGDNFDDAAARFHSAIRAWRKVPVLVETAARAFLRPRVRVVARVGGSEVPGALVYLDGKRAPDSDGTPAVLVLEEGETYEVAVDYRNGHRFYKGSAAWTADYARTRELRIDLRRSIGGDPTAVSWSRLGRRWVLNIYGSRQRTVTDRKTGLMWHRKPSSLGTAEWFEAKQICRGLEYGGHDDWVLPERVQLEGLFAGKPPFGQNDGKTYWSATKYYPRGIYHGVVAVDSRNGRSQSEPEQRKYHMWPCRDASREAP